MPINPAPTQQETLDHPCEWCKQQPETWAEPGEPHTAAVRCSTSSCPVRKAGWVSPGFWNTRVVGPQRDDVDAERLAATVVALWRAENSDDRTLVKYIKQSLSGARIGVAAASSPAPAESELPFDDYCAGKDCRTCAGVNCTCQCHAPVSRPDWRFLLKPSAWRCQKCAGALMFNDEGVPTYSCLSCELTWPAENIVLFGYADLTDEMFVVAPAERTEVAGEQKCVKCGHTARRWHGFCQFRATDDVVNDHVCGCQCEFNATSDSARRAAEEIHKLCDEVAPDIPNDSTSYAPSVEQITAIISKHFAAAPADNDAESPAQPEQIVVIDGKRRRVVSCPDGREGCEVLHTEPIITTKGDR